MNLDDLYGPVQQDLDLVDETIDALRDVDYQPMAEMLELVLAARGKRLRPALALLAGKFGRYRLDLLVPLAAAIELLHTATLVHDDVIDNAATRRGRPTANSVLHNTTTVMLGDYMFAHAATFAARTGNIEVIRLFSQTVMTIARGEIGQDMAAYDTRQTVRQYLQRIGGKTASLFSAACQGGALLTGASEDRVEALKHYGYNLGMAFQIVDDILDVVATDEQLGKPAGNDLLEGVYTLPVLRALQTPVGDELASLLGGELTIEARDRARELVRASDGVDEALHSARSWADKAGAVLTSLPDSPATTALLAAADHLIRRAQDPLT